MEISIGEKNGKRTATLSYDRMEDSLFMQWLHGFLSEHDAARIVDLRPPLHPETAIGMQVVIE
ncbi:MAG: hypothetical protein AAB691_02515 [Patescibacteria group bacterium]